MSSRASSRPRKRSTLPANELPVDGSIIENVLQAEEKKKKKFAKHQALQTKGFFLNSSFLLVMCSAAFKRKSIVYVLLTASTKAVASRIYSYVLESAGEKPLTAEDALKYGANFLLGENVTVKFHADFMEDGEDDNEDDKENHDGKIGKQPQKFIFYGGYVRNAFYVLNKVSQRAQLIYDVE
jgi:hypothetical protein